MQYSYPAVFYPEDNGRYTVVFPDLNSLATFGDDIADTFAMGYEACWLYLSTAIQDGEQLPAPTPVDNVTIDDDGAFARIICIDMSRQSCTETEKTMAAIIGELIQTRQKQRISQKKLAELSGAKQSDIERMENGTAIPQLDTIFEGACPAGKDARHCASGYRQMIF